MGGGLSLGQSVPVGLSMHRCTDETPAKCEQTGSTARPSDLESDTLQSRHAPLTACEIRTTEPAPKTPKPQNPKTPLAKFKMI